MDEKAEHPFGVHLVVSSAGLRLSLQADMIADLVMETFEQVGVTGPLERLSQAEPIQQTTNTMKRTITDEELCTFLTHISNATNPPAPDDDLRAAIDYLTKPPSGCPFAEQISRMFDKGVGKQIIAAMKHHILQKAIDEGSPLRL